MTHMWLAPGEDPREQKESPRGERDWDLNGAVEDDDVVEEYARHCGHADPLRERIDGRTGQ